MNWIQLAIIVCEIISSVTVCSVFVHTGWLSLCKYCQTDYKLDTGLIGRATDRTAGSGSDLLHSIIKSLHWIQWQIHLILWNVHIVYESSFFIHEKIETQTYQIQNVLQIVCQQMSELFIVLKVCNKRNFNFAHRRTGMRM